MRRLVLLLALAAALAGAAPAAAATDRGIVVRVRPWVLVLRELDGTRVRIPVGPATRVVRDGFPATLAELQRGDVAIVVHFGNRPAVRIRAFSQ